MASRADVKCHVVDLTEIPVAFQQPHAHDALRGRMSRGGRVSTRRGGMSALAWRPIARATRILATTRRRVIAVTPFISEIRVRAGGGGVLTNSGLDFEAIFDPSLAALLIPLDRTGPPE